MSAVVKCNATNPFPTGPERQIVELASRPKLGERIYKGATLATLIPTKGTYPDSGWPFRLECMNLTGHQLQPFWLHPIPSQIGNPQMDSTTGFQPKRRFMWAQSRPGQELSTEAARLWGHQGTLATMKALNPFSTRLLILGKLGQACWEARFQA